MKPPKKLPNGKKSDVKVGLIDEEGNTHEIPTSNKPAGVDPSIPQRTWYDWLKPIVGLKWGATLVLLFYSFFEGLSDARLMWACIIVAAFLFLEWLDMGIKDFRRIQ